MIALIWTSPEGLFLQTIYHPLRLFSEHMRGNALDVVVSSPTVDLTGREDGDGRGQRVADLGRFTVLDASAVRGEGSELVVAVVNRDDSRTLRTELMVRGGGEAGDRRATPGERSFLGEHQLL